MKRNLLKTVLAACAMVLGTIGAWAGTMTYTFTSLASTMAIGSDSYTAANEITVYQGTNPEFGGKFYFSKCSGNDNKNVGWWWRDKNYGVNWNAEADKDKSTMSVKGLLKGDVVSFTLYNGSLTLLSNNVEGKSVNDKVFTGGSKKANTTTVTMSADGNLDLLGSYCGIQKVSITSTAEMLSTPMVTITKVSGTGRVVTITPGASSESSNTVKTYYTTDGTDPTTSSTEYTGPFTLSETKTVKAITISSSGKTSTISELQVKAGTAIALNQATFSLGLSSSEDVYNPTISASIDNSKVLCSPVATVSYTFTPDGGVAKTVETLPYTITEAGTFTATATSDGYDNSVATYTFANAKFEAVASKSFDFTTVSASNLTDVLGDGWSVSDNTSRWSNWSKSGGKNSDLTSNGGETYYKANSTSKTTKDYLEIPQSAFLLFGYGIGSNLSGGKSTPFGVNGLNTYIVQFVGAGPSATTEYVEITDDNYTYNGIINSNVLSKVNVYKPISNDDTSIQLASFSSSSATTVPSGVSVYKAKISGDYVVLTKVETSTIPANTGVILRSNADDESVTTGTETNFDGNELIATSVEANATVPTEGTYYALAKGESKFGVLKGGITLSNNKAYIKASATASDAKTVLSIKFGGDTTGISSATTETTKADNAYYTLQGVKTMKPAKGLYIHNGKKVIVK